ncbi:Kelch-like protein 10 [Myotis brandtii]|uniref:Kelch-like protein 10 n=1 Tax=Myotis brandtii TaxID=109478 RepID=S7PYK5_MYOBR|nr:Kelch-like protein 10 [Myotis brandtii]
MEMENKAASTRFHQPHMERKMSAMTCEIFNELRLEGKLCDVVIKVNGFEFNAHKNILCSCSSYFRERQGEKHQCESVASCSHDDRG